MATAKWDDKGIADFIAAFDGMADRSTLDEIAGTALYAMAHEVANAIASSLAGLRTSPERKRKTDEAYYLSPRQKTALQSSFGISKKQQKGASTWDVRLGFDGYNDVKTKKYPGGQPNAMIARTVESGSTYMIKQPFFRKAVNASKPAAKKAGQDAAIEKISEKLK